MAVLIRNLTTYVLRLGSPVNGTLQPREDKVFQFVAYDDVINTEVVYSRIASGTIVVINLDDLTQFNDLEQVIIIGKDTTAMTAGYAAYVSGNSTFMPTNADHLAGSFLTSTFAGVYAGTAGQIVVGGIVEVLFDAGLGVVAGDPAVLSWITPGKFRNTRPISGSGHYYTLVGEVENATLYATTGRVTIILHPAPPIKVSGP